MSGIPGNGIPGTLGMEEATETFPCMGGMGPLATEALGKGRSIRLGMELGGGG